MSRNINLVLKEGAEGLRHKKRLKRFRLFAVGSLLVVLFISLSIYLLINFIFGTSSIERDKDAISSQLLPLREKEARLKVINDRLKNATQALQGRTDVYNIVNTFLAEIPNDMSVDNLKFNQGLVVIKVSSDSLTVVDQFVKNLISLGERKELVGKLILKSLSVGELGRYEVAVNISLI